MMPLLVMLLTTSAPDRLRTAELPAYPRSPHVRLGDELAIAGERIRISYFTTPDPAPLVARHFLAEWRRAGWVVTHDRTGEVETVSAFRTLEGLQLSVILRPSRGRTVAFSVVRDLWSQVRAPADAATPDRIRLGDGFAVSLVRSAPAPGSTMKDSTLFPLSADWSLRVEPGRFEEGER
jgi:hypothetical protein